MKRSWCLAVLLVLAASAAWGQTWYGLQENGLEPNYRNQDGYGTCWTFGTMSSVESNLIKEGLLPQSTDGLSERDLAWHSGYGGGRRSLERRRQLHVVLGLFRPRRRALAQLPGALLE